ncbi:hypothetical protein BOS5A_120001 [Bosea sp. EC-HK365B]|nr:hypothetical protein BOS5A_120001 [Bosea sp. EC-HK365B]
MGARGRGGRLSRAALQSKRESSRTSGEAAPIRDPFRSLSDRGSGMGPGSPSGRPGRLALE